MKVAIYYPDSWKKFAIDLRVDVPQGSDRGVAWWDVKLPEESHPNEVEVVIEDDE